MSLYTQLQQRAADKVQITLYDWSETGLRNNLGIGRCGIATGGRIRSTCSSCACSGARSCSRSSSGADASRVSRNCRTASHASESRARGY